MSFSLAVEEFSPSPQESSSVPLNQWDHKGATSQEKVSNSFPSSWKDDLETVQVTGQHMWRLVKDQAFEWTPDTPVILGVLRHLPLHPTVVDNIRMALQGYHNSSPISNCTQDAHDKRTGQYKPVTHIGFWAKPGRKRKGKRSGYPWVTTETTKQSQDTNVFLTQICKELEENINPHLMNTLRLEDPKLWWRMTM